MLVAKWKKNFGAGNQIYGKQGKFIGLNRDNANEIKNAAIFWNLKDGRQRVGDALLISREEVREYIEFFEVEVVLKKNE